MCFFESFKEVFGNKMHMDLTFQLIRSPISLSGSIVNFKRSILYFSSGLLQIHYFFEFANPAEECIFLKTSEK